MELQIGDGVQSSGYAAYVNGILERLALIQMIEWNVTHTGTMPNVAFKVKVSPGYESRRVRVERVIADGSDATSAVTFGDTSFNTPNGEPVTVNVTGGGEVVSVGTEGLLSTNRPARARLS